MKVSIEKLKYVLIVLVIITIGVALWFATSLIVESSYSSKDLVIKKELEKATENTVEAFTEEPIVIEEGSIEPNYLSEEELRKLIDDASKNTTSEK